MIDKINNLLTTLFYKVWKNIYIKSLIIDQIRIYNIYKFKRLPQNEKELQKKEAKYYSWLLLHSDNLTEFINYLPASVNIIEFADNRNGTRKPVNLKSLPSTVTSLKFNKSDECQIDSNFIPNTIKSISIGKIHYELTLNDGLTNLDVGGSSSSGGGSFDCNLFSLPPNLKTFKCNSPLLSAFNLDILPTLSITNLDFSGSGLTKFNNGIGDLCKLLNLTSLNLGNSYKESILKGSLPNGLRVLKLSNDFNVKTGLSIGSIPYSVTYLNFEPLKLNNSQVSYPQRELIKLSSKLLPRSLTKLGIGRNHYLSISSLKSGKNKCGHLKDFYKIIISGSGFNKSEIPKTINKLKYINLSSNIYSTPILVIPTHIKSISTNGNFRIINSKDLKNLINLKCLNGDLKSCIHENMPLKSLVCNGILLQPQINLFNNNNLLTCLSIQIHGINNSLHQIKYPQSITILELLTDFHYHIDTDNLPSSITTLILCGSTTDIKLPISQNIKSLYISSNNINLLNNLNPIENNNLLNVLKVFNGDNGKTIFKKLIKLNI